MREGGPRSNLFRTRPDSIHFPSLMTDCLWALGLSDKASGNPFPDKSQNAERKEEGSVELKKKDGNLGLSEKGDDGRERNEHIRRKKYENRKRKRFMIKKINKLSDGNMFRQNPILEEDYFTFLNREKKQ